MGSKEAETTKRVAAVAEAVAASRRPSPGYPAFGILVAFVILAGIGSVLAIASNRSIFGKATRVNCTTNAALRNSYVDLLYRLTTPRVLPAGSSAALIDYTNKVNKIATDYRDAQLKNLRAVNCGLLAAGSIQPLPLPPEPPPPPVVAVPGSAAPLPLAPLTGAMGPGGPAGKDGKDGQPGRNGNSILNGSGPPASEAGTVGDFYIDAVATTFYGPKTSAGWGEPTSLKGPIGGQGVPGAPAPPAPTPTPTPSPTPVTLTVTAPIQPTPTPSPCLLTVSSTAVTIGGLVCP